MCALLWGIWGEINNRLFRGVGKEPLRGNCIIDPIPNPKMFFHFLKLKNFVLLLTYIFFLMRNIR